MEDKRRNNPFIRMQHDENREKERIQYYFFEQKSKIPLYLEKIYYLDVLKNYPYFEINEDNLYPLCESLKEFFKKNANAEYTFIIIDTNKISQENQERLSYMVKDRSWQTVWFPESCQVVVIGNKDEIANRLLGLLVFASY